MKSFNKSFMYQLDSNLTECKNNIWVYFWGKYISKIKIMPYFIAENRITKRWSPIIILNKHVISLDKQFKQEAKFIKDNLDLFMKSWYDKDPYNKYLYDILKLLKSGKSLESIENKYKDYNTHEDDIDIISSNYNLDHDILLFNNKIEIELPKCKLIKVTIKNGKVKAHTIFHKKDIQKELDFINKYKDIFEIGSRYDLYRNILCMIRDKMNGVSLHHILINQGIIDSTGITIPPIIYKYSQFDNYTVSNEYRIYLCSNYIKLFGHLFNINFTVYLNLNNLNYKIKLIKE